MLQFTADQATVHTAIGRRIGIASHNVECPGEVGLPAYVPRAHDDLLRADIAAAAAVTCRR